MQGKQESPPSSHSTRMASLLIRLSAERCEEFEKIDFVLASARLQSRKGTLHDLPVAQRRIVWDLKRSDSLSFLIAAPAGTFDGIVLAIEQATLMGRGGEKSTVAPVEWRGTLSAPATISIREGETTRLALRVDVTALSRGGDAPTDVLSAESEIVGFAAHHRVSGDGPQTITLAAPSFNPKGERAASLRIARESFPRGTDVRLRRTDLNDLPELFRGQRALGSPVEIRASAPLRGEVELTVSYDDGARAASGLRPDQLIVLQLDDARTLYRELRPAAVDTTAHTLTVRTRSLSIVFAWTPGVLI